MWPALALADYARGMDRYEPSSVQVVIIVDCCRGGSTKGWSIWPLDGQGAVPTCGILVNRVELLSKLVEFCQVVAGDRASGTRECLLEVLPSNLAGCICVHAIIACCQLIRRDCVANRCLGCTLAQLSQVCATEALCLLRNKRQRHIGCDGRL